MRRSPWAIGSSAANRLPTLHTCHPTHSAFQCSTAVKIQPHPSSNVKTRTPSVPHITFGACVTIVPACTRAAPWRPRCGESSLCVRITRSTRVRATRIPSKICSRVDLPMALALERRAVEIGLNRLQQRRVRHRGRRTPPRGLLALVPLLLACLPGVERRARALPRLTHALDPVGAPRGLGERGAHRRDLRIAKGRRCSAARARSRSSSFSIDSSPMCRFAASSASATRSPWRACKPRSRPATARSRSPPAGRSRRPLPATAPPAIRLAAAAAPRPASGPRSSAAPAPGAPPHLPRRRRALPVALRAPSVPADAFTCTLLDRTISPTPLDIGFSPNQCPRKLGAL